MLLLENVPWMTSLCFVVSFPIHFSSAILFLGGGNGSDDRHTYQVSSGLNPIHVMHHTLRRRRRYGPRNCRPRYYSFHLFWHNRSNSMGNEKRRKGMGNFNCLILSVWCTTHSCSFCGSSMTCENAWKFEQSLRRAVFVFRFCFSSCIIGSSVSGGWGPTPQRPNAPTPQHSSSTILQHYSSITPALERRKNKARKTQEEDTYALASKQRPEHHEALGIARRAGA